jgi:hypothetical protein
MSSDPPARDRIVIIQDDSHMYYPLYSIIQPNVFNKPRFKRDMQNGTATNVTWSN